MFQARTAAALSMLSFATVAPCATVYSTGFESGEFAAGSTLNGQNGWTVPFSFLSPSAATVEAVNPASGSQAVRIRGSDMVSAPELAGSGLDAVGSYRHTVSYDTSVAHQTYTTVSADVRLDGPVSHAADFFSCNLAAVAAGDAGMEISLSSDGDIYVYDNNTGNRIGAAYPISFGAYYHLTGVVDFASDTYSAYVNGAFIASAPFDPATVTTTLDRGSVVAYAAPDTTGAAGDSRSSYTAYFDNFSITAVPAPASVAVFSLAALLARRRRGPMAG